MYSRKLLPPGTSVPETLAGNGFLLRPLRLADAEADFEAVTASAERLRGWMNPGSTWPDGLTLYENRVDLGWHEREFTEGHSFAWTITTPDGARVIGCAYLYPSDRLGYDAMAYWWMRTGETGRDAAVGAAFRGLIANLPLARVAFPGRDVGWDVWQRLAPRG